MLLLMPLPLLLLLVSFLLAVQIFRRRATVRDPSLVRGRLLRLRAAGGAVHAPPLLGQSEVAKGTMARFDWLRGVQTRPSMRLAPLLLSEDSKSGRTDDPT